MSEPALRLLPGGEIPEKAPSYPDALMLIERMRGELDGWRLRFGNLQKELERVQGQEPEAQDVRLVGNYHARRVVEEGWWSRKPAFRPGSKAWSAVRARLKEPEYDTDYCFAVVEGALMQPKDGLKREWLTAASIFASHNIERHYERAQDPHCERVREAKAIPDEFLALDGRTLRHLAEPCDCGHPRLEHSKATPPHGFQPCLAKDCECIDFDDINQRAAKWLEGKAA